MPVNLYCIWIQELDEPVRTSFTSSGCQVSAASSDFHSPSLAIKAWLHPPPHRDSQRGSQCLHGRFLPDRLLRRARHRKPRLPTDYVRSRARSLRDDLLLLQDSSFLGKSGKCIIFCQDADSGASLSEACCKCSADPADPALNLKTFFSRISQ